MTISHGNKFACLFSACVHFMPLCARRSIYGGGSNTPVGNVEIREEMGVLVCYTVDKYVDSAYVLLCIFVLSFTLKIQFQDEHGGWCGP